MVRTHTTRQVDDWVDLTRSLLERAWLPGWHLSVLPRLSGTFESASSFAWVSPDPLRPMRADVYGAPAGWPPQEQPQWNGLLRSHHPLLLWYARTGQAAAMATSHVPSGIATARDLAIYRELANPYELGSEVSIPVSAARGEHCAFVVARARDYSTDDLQLAQLIQPLLVLLHRQSQVLENATPAAALAGALTARELAVLQLLAQGHTARVIARRLGISERTTHKHLQNTYRKLGAHDRVTALRMAASAGMRVGEGASPSDRPDAALEPALDHAAGRLQHIGTARP